MQTPGFQYQPTDPSYQFRFNEGQRAIDRSAAAGGSLYSGGTLKALARYGQDYASTEFGKDFDRNNQLAKYGFNAAQGMANTQSGYVNSLFAAADGRAGARMDRADAIGDQYGSAVSGIKDIAAFFL
jgi:gamma-glutamyltranspeptidase